MNDILRPKALATGKWWDRPWSLVDGCTEVSEGCRNCWSRANARRFKRDWTPRFRADRLELPLRTRKPTVWAVWNDLFHEKVGVCEILSAFVVMALSPQHLFLVLTKRPWRLAGLDFLRDPDPASLLEDHAGYDCWSEETCCHVANAINGVMGEGHNVGWPMRNVAIGVTVEDQATADERVPLLLQTPARWRFVSYEPALGPVALGRTYPDEYTACLKCGWHGPTFDYRCADCGGPPDAGYESCAICGTATLHRACPKCRATADVGHPMEFYREDRPLPGIDLVIAGGETGPKARPAHPDWFRFVRDQCKAAGTPFLLKQHGPNKRAGRLLAGVEHNGWFGDEA